MKATSHNPRSADPDEPKPELSVILSSFNRLRSLARTMDSIHAQNIPSAKCELIVMIDGGDDDRLEYLRALQAKYSFRIIKVSNRRLAVALNEAVAAARGRIALFTSDNLALDCENFSARLTSHDSEKPRVVFDLVLVPADDRGSLAMEWTRATIAEEASRREGGRSSPHDAKFTPPYSISLATLRACGGFDVDLSSRCHDELGIRLSKMGAYFFNESSAISQVVEFPTAKPIVDPDARERGKEELLVLRKHPELRPHSELARLADTPSWKWLAIQVAARSPISPELVLRPLFAFADRLRSQPSMRRFGLSVLRTRVVLSFLRGAVEAVSWRPLQAEIGMRLPVFMYHHVGPPQPDSEPALFVSAARFEAHLRFLTRKGYKGIRASDWTAWLKDAKPLPEKSVLLTFDDAISDLYEHAFPALERFGFNAVVFVPTNCIGKGNLWNHSLGYKWRPCLNAEQIQYWSMRGFEFGAHSRNHPDLTQLNESELQDEITGSRIDLERIADSPVTSFAYPYGHYNSAGAQCVGRQFDLGFTVEEGLNSLRTNSSLLRRCTVFEWDTLLDLDLMLHLGWNPIRRLRIRQRFRGLKRRLRIDKH